MPTKDPNNYVSLLQFIGFAALALWGGFVSYYQRFLRVGREFRLMIFVGELSTSALAGIVTFYLCRAYDISEPLTAAFVALAGHAGGKLLEMAETIMRRKASSLVGPSDKPEGGDK